MDCADREQQRVVPPANDRSDEPVCIDAGPSPSVQRGTCYVLFACDVGLSIDLDQAEHRVAETRTRHRIRGKRHAPAYFEYDPPPVRLTLPIEPITIDRYQTSGQLTAMLYDFGAVAITYEIPLQGAVSDLILLSEELYDNEELLGHARGHVEQLLSAIAPTVSKPQMSDLTEDYVIFEIEALDAGTSLEETLRGHRRLFAQLLRAERNALSEQEVSDALACRLSFGTEDLVLIDWNAALVFERGADDVRDVLEFANVEMLEMRYLDNRLDAALDESYGALAQPPSTLQLLWTSQSGRLRRLVELQMDAVLMFEGVNNALKLLGDQYLARLYRAASQRLHLDDWDASIIRKLKVLDSIYAKLSDHLSHRRLELLEWIIIVLIALSTLVSVLLPH